MRRVLALAVTGALLLVPTAGAASPSPTPTAAVQVDQGKAVPSENLPDVYVFTGSGYLPGTPVLVSVNGLDVVQIESTALGDFTARVTLLGEGASALTAAGAGADGPRVVTAAVTRGEEQDGDRRATAGDDIPTRVYTNLLAGLAAVLFLVMLVVARQAVRRRPGAPS
jgi:hypothetical protein